MIIPSRSVYLMLAVVLLFLCGSSVTMAFLPFISISIFYRPVDLCGAPETFDRQYV